MPSLRVTSSLPPIALADRISQGGTLAGERTLTTTVTFYVPLDLKLRIDEAAAADRRSRSQYLVMLLEKI